MKNIVSNEVIARGVRLNYYRTGIGKQPLVLVHGITDDALCWSSVAEALYDSFDIILVDMRGHGKSDAPESGYTLENLARELADFTQQLGLEKPIFVGHSMGAVTSLTLSGMFPDLSCAVVLVDPPAFWHELPQDPTSVEHRKSVSAWIHSIKRKTREELFEEARTKNWTDVDRERWVNAKQRVSPRVIELVTPPDLPSINLPGLISQIKCPVLLMQGDLDQGAICSDEDAASLRALLPSIQSVHIAKGTHTIYRSRFVPFMTALENFLSELDNG